MREKPTQVTPTPADEALCEWLTERYSGDEFATRLQVVQWINNQRGEPVFTFDQKVDPADGKAKPAAKPKLTRERLVEIANKIVAVAQADCDALRRSTVYAVLAHHPLMGPDAYARHLLRLAPKSALAVDADSVVSEDNIMSTRLLLGLLADEKRDKRWVMELAMNVVSGAAERDSARIAALESAVGATWERQGKLLEAIEAAHVARARVEIEAQNAAEDRKDRIAARERDHMWNEVTRASLLGAVETVKQLFPGFGALFLAKLQGRDAPPPPQLADGGGASTPLASGAAPTAAAASTPATAPAGGAPPASIPEERQLLDRFVDAADKNKMPDGWTSAERLFGKDTDDGKPIAAGVFDRAQVAILAGVRAGKVGVDALDALLPDSGKPEAIREEQMLRAMAFLTPPMLDDCMAFLKLRKDARDATPPRGAP